MVRKKQQQLQDQVPEPLEEEMDKPECYGTFDGSRECLKKCALLDVCRRLTGRLNSPDSPTKGLSRKKAIKAFCRSCNGGSTRAGCSAFCCQFYPWLPEHRQLAGPPDLWWFNTPSHKLDEAEKAARSQKRKIKKDDFIPGLDEGSEDEDDQDDQEE
jgi:hypothetical protein